MHAHSTEFVDIPFQLFFVEDPTPFHITYGGQHVLCDVDVWPSTIPDSTIHRLEKFPNIKVTVRNKADSLFKIVGAASCAAKVTRDFIVEEWVWQETSKKGEVSLFHPKPSLWPLLRLTNDAV